MDASDKFGLLASGGTDGTVILWRLRVEPRSNVKSLDKLIYYSIAKYVDPVKALELAEYNVQSVWIGKNRILIGTRSGNIFEIEISEDEKLIKPKQGQEIKLKKWIQCIDHETPRNLSIDKTSTRIFTITTMGMFSIWDLRTFELIYTREFYKRAKMIYSFKLSNKVMIVFENEIIVLDSNPNENKFEEMTRYNLKLNTISDCKVNNNEKILGVATISAAAPEVSLYDTDDGFTLLKTLYGFKSSIKYIDFSTDNYYLQCEDNLGEVMLFEIETQRVVHTDAIDFELEWLGEGLKSSSTLKGVHYFYDHNNKITEIAKVIGLPVVAIGDDLGTIRLFSYPNKTGDPYYQWYSDHLFSVSNCLFSPNRKFLLSTSEYDRCIIKWKVNYRADIIEKYEAQELF